MQLMIENLINGNLSEARKIAKRFSSLRIIAFCLREMGWNQDKAFRAAFYLKTGKGFQDYCDCD